MVDSISSTGEELFMLNFVHGDIATNILMMISPHFILSLSNESMEGLDNFLQFQKLGCYLGGADDKREKIVGARVKGFLCRWISRAYMRADVLDVLMSMSYPRFSICEIGLKHNKTGGGSNLRPGRCGQHLNHSAMPKRWEQNMPSGCRTHALEDVVGGLSTEPSIPDLPPRGLNSRAWTCKSHVEPLEPALACDQRGERGCVNHQAKCLVEILAFQIGVKAGLWGYVEFAWDHLNVYTFMQGVGRGVGLNFSAV
ncbi:hypothetical protein VNO77_27002 [Canavalia gladiata]|uniref:DUF7812 domain-containing protein n=1 Tax=Canavalia gladiata TaxID=3824 RepID=A0AAN9Q3U2_CANGL